MTVNLHVDGVDVEVRRDEVSLLAALRDELGVRGPKDGCSPQGQCGCCTVLVDGAPRVACVTAVRRVAGRSITTIDGLDPAVVGPIVEALVAAGGSQCGFCTPGIVCRLASLGPAPEPARVETALLAHLCRCTGWRTIVEAVTAPSGSADAPALPAPARPDGSADAPALPAPPRIAAAGRRLEAAARRATIEGGTPQRVGTDVAMGRGGFADDSAPPGALVAVPDAEGGWAVGETLEEARTSAGKVQGRRSGHGPTWPLEIPPGEWAVTLQTTWTEPGYLEPDASWCEPGGVPAAPLGNGGAFGGKASSPVAAAARLLADRYGRAVRVLFTREDVVRLGPKRPPVAAGLGLDGSGVIRVAATPGVTDAVAAQNPLLVVEPVALAGPATSAALRAAGWAEAAVLLAAVVARRDDRVGDGPSASGWAEIVSPAGSTARAEVDLDAGGLPAAVGISVACGDPLDETVLRSYAVGAAHMALGWVLTEAVAVDGSGAPEDLTVRSWGILRARDTPPVEVRIAAGDGAPVNGSDAVFAAVAAATWIALGLPARWPARPGAFA
jgi:xanthine dehydrogenase small subunit